MAIPDGGVAGSRVGIGDNFAKTRLLLAKQAGYLPNNQPLAQGNPVQQWAAVSKNLAGDARKAGFGNPMQFLRQGALQGGTAKPTALRAGNAGVGGALAYYNSRMAQAAPMMPQQGQPQALPQPMPQPMPGVLPQIHGLPPAAVGQRIAALQAMQPQFLPRGGVPQ